jgi:hypothetical protein
MRSGSVRRTHGKGVAADESPVRLTGEVISLGRGLRDGERKAVARTIRALVAWQSDLLKWPKFHGVPDATPYVSLYVHGELRGCYGSHEGTPCERLARAFMLALTDTRYGRVTGVDREALSADVAYITRASPVRGDQAAAMLEPGKHGVAVSDGERTTVLLPSVARERGKDAEGMLDLLARKADRPRSMEGIVWLLDVEEVHSQGSSDRDPRRAAKRFLESLVARDGQVSFELAVGTGQERASGVMRHGRIAVAVEALAALGSASARRARAWLEREIEQGLEAPHRTLGWPDRPDMMLGTLALAARAGAVVPLAPFAASVDPKTCSPWHAAQAAVVLGAKTPPALWSVCTSALQNSPSQALAPYTLLAARVRGDGPIVERCARALTSAIRKQSPFMGGASFTAVPETALTALTVEALATLSDREARRAVRLARGFVLARQVLAVPASMHPRALGGFLASPIAPMLRCDVTGHAVLAAIGA